MAPSYANIFMAELEEALLANYPIKPLLWKRYIDDILCLWTETPAELNRFTKYLNQFHPTIKFTHESSTNSIDFLDLTIYKGRRHATSNILDVKPFFKPTNKLQYLQYDSAHPKGTFASLAKGELTRLLRGCSDEEAYRKVSDKLLKALKERGYPDHLLHKALQQVPFQNRRELFQQNKENRATPYDTFMKVSYTPNLNTTSLRKILKPKGQEINQVPNPCLSLSKTDNLAKKLVRAKLKQFPDPPLSTTPVTIQTTRLWESNSVPCKIPGCHCCTAISKKCRITSTLNNSYPTQKYTSCGTKNIIYLIECTKCNKGNQYVGHSKGPLRTKLQEHKEAHNRHTDLPLYRHFSQDSGHQFEENINITILQATTRNSLLEMKNKWIRLLDTIYPKGLNSQTHH